MVPSSAIRQFNALFIFYTIMLHVFVFFFIYFILLHAYSRVCEQVRARIKQMHKPKLKGRMHNAVRLLLWTPHAHILYYRYSCVYFFSMVFFFFHFVYIFLILFVLLQLYIFLLLLLLLLNKRRRLCYMTYMSAGGKKTRRRISYTYTIWWWLTYTVHIR